MMTYEACERMRTMLAYSDHETEFRQLLQRANRANVSFYPIDARGLVVFDTPIELGVPPYVDRAWLTHRYEGLRTMALQTDGEAVLDTNDVSGAMQKVFADVGSYYLLGYYSTNQKLDGRFRRIRVEVKRDDVQVRARPGYLAPTESGGARRRRVDRSAGAKPAPPPTVTRALDALAPARGNLPVRVQAVGGRSSIRAIVEIDAATAKQPEWLSGGTLRLTFEPERVTGSSSVGTSQTLTMAIDPGQRSIVISGSEQPLAAGRYAVRAELTPRNGRLPLQVTTFATVPAEAAEVGTGGLAPGAARAQDSHTCDRRSAIPPHRALTPRGAACRRGIHRRRTPADPRGPGDAAHRRVFDANRRGDQATVRRRRRHAGAARRRRIRGRVVVDEGRQDRGRHLRFPNRYVLRSLSPKIPRRKRQRERLHRAAVGALHAFEDFHLHEPEPLERLGRAEFQARDFPSCNSS